MSNETPQKSRAAEVDVLRGLGIILMIMGHVGFSKFKVFDKWIHGFHMPLWFVITGYFFSLDRIRNQKARHFIVSKFQSTMIPYFVFGGV